MLNSISYTQIKDSFEEAARELAVMAGDDPDEFHWTRGFFTADDGSDIFVEMTIFDFELNVQLGPVLTPAGELERDIVTVDNLERAARMLHQGLTYREDILF